jgi:cytochrome c oxidase subunit 2
VCMWMCGFVLACVTVAILYIVVRYRARDGHEPPQVAGNKKLEIAWTLIPLALVGLLFVLSITTAQAVDRPVTREPDIIVTGHQWWWEVGYPAANVITANEIHVPVGNDTPIGIEAAEVIHDFGVPRLTRKLDAIPGRRNFVSIRAAQTGDFDGACPEYWEPQNAWMPFRVVVQDPAAYDGINAQKQYAPDLTHVASREMFAAGRISSRAAISTCRRRRTLAGHTRCVGGGSRRDGGLAYPTLFTAASWNEALHIIEQLRRTTLRSEKYG